MLRHGANRYYNQLFSKLRVKQRLKYVFRRHLLLANISVSTFLSTVADCIEQGYEKYVSTTPHKHDFHRTAVLGGSGVTTGIVSHYWYQLIDKILPGKTLVIALKKVSKKRNVSAYSSISVHLT